MGIDCPDVDRFFVGGLLMALNHTFKKQVDVGDMGSLQMLLYSVQRQMIS